MKNTVFTVHVGGVRYCHMGDNRHDMPNAVADAIGDVDVLMVTVDDSCRLLSYGQVDELIDRLGPKAVIPMHYCLLGVAAAESTLQPAEGWLKTQNNVNYLGIDGLTLDGSDMPRSGQVWVMNIE